MGFGLGFNFGFNSRQPAAATVAAPTIDSESGDGVYDGVTAQTLSVTASGTGLSYQWYAGASGDTSSPVGGATNATYAASPANPTRYWCRVTNAGGTADSTTKNILTKSSSTFTFDLDPANGITVAETDKITAAASQGSVALSLTNDGGANRPVLVTGDTNFNSQKTIRFNNSNYFYQTVTWTNLLAVGTKHIFIVARITTLTALKGLLSDDNVRFQIKVNAAGTGIGVFNNGSEIVTATLGANTTALIEVTHTGGNITLRINAGATSTAASGDTTGMGTYINVGTVNGAANFVGEIGRMLMKNTVFTGEALACIRGYLGNRYGVTVS
jgi:hypothetical protein